jgi:L,D-transpeptidase ErfK/SrfK
MMTGLGVVATQAESATPLMSEVGRGPESPFVAVFDLKDDLVGSTKLHIIQGKETLIDVARLYDVGFDELKAANPGVDTFIPGDGRTIVVPGSHLLPATPHKGIVVNTAEMRLYYYSPDGKHVATFPVGIGREGLETPLGKTRVARKRKHPVWYPTKSSFLENPDLPKAVRPGPDNPLGDYALDLGWDEYLIHGTNKPPGVGRRVSHGCMRMYPEDIERLYGWSKVGTPVTVVSQPVKFGWHNGALYIEISPSMKQIAEIENTGEDASGTTGEDATPENHDGRKDVANLREQVIAVAGEKAAEVDWHAVFEAAHVRDGVPVRITE